MNRFEIGTLGLAACGAAALVATQANAEAHDDLETELATVEMSAADIVQARRVTYFLTTQAVGQIKGGIEEGGDLRRTRFAAQLLVRWAETLPSMFPEGTDIEGSRALPTVWSDREGFEAAAAAYRDAAQGVMDAAETGDREATNTAFLTMAGTCQACHDTYRQ
ncbi:cytochrome c [uncultured Erythrobacter sp.]|uniref:c-type cytochrome n=1 Tax=uncultured Erythrobacter sp. TaxID=263913 RepID=UPI00261E6B4E|nr:cytochrome c [uncultured Erythrobacter sp.]